MVAARSTVPEMGRPVMVVVELVSFFRTIAPVFGSRGDVYVLDGLDMTATHTITFLPDAQVLFVLSEFDLLQRPAGDKINAGAYPCATLP